MAEDSESGLERTEPASQRRLEQAREEGDVPRSRELATCTILIAAGSGLWMTGGSVVRQMRVMMTAGMSFDRSQVFDFNLLAGRLSGNLVDVMTALIPLALLLIIVAMASPVLIGGWLFAGSALIPNFARLNPISGLANIISVRAGVELLKAIGKASLVGIVAWLVVSHQINAVMGLTLEPLLSGSTHVAYLVLESFIAIACGLVLIVVIDVPYQLIHYANKLKMTREEVKQESKEADGNPQIKAKIRQQQREMARRRMMSKIPTADVVVTNPTHYAVALQYSATAAGAPRVVAKGADAVAAKIREIAREHRVPILEAPPLARALHQHTDLGDEIPQALYTAVAEVLAYVFQLRTYAHSGGAQPQEPKELAVPADLDPQNPAYKSRTERLIEARAMS